MKKIYPLLDPRPVRVGFSVDKVLLVLVFQRVLLLSLSVPNHRRSKLKFVYHRRCVNLATASSNTKILLCLSVCILQVQRFSICLVAFHRLASLKKASVIIQRARSYANACRSVSTTGYKTSIRARNNKSRLDNTNKQ